MRNRNYTPEIIMAQKFILDHSYDGELKNFIYQMMHESDDMMHSERWAEVYDWMNKHYPNHMTGELITGLTYYIES